MKRNTKTSSKPLYASENVWTVLFFIAMAVIAFSVSSCNKDTAEPKINDYFGGHYIKIDPADYVSDTLVVDCIGYNKNGPFKSTTLYHFKYPKFSTTCNYSINSSRPEDVISIWSDNEHSDIIHYENEIGAIDGYFNNDTLYLTIYPYIATHANIRYVYKYVKI